MNREGSIGKSDTVLTSSIAFHGAAGTVTGSCFLLRSDGRKVLIDCGLFQGSKTERQLNFEPFPFAPVDLDAVLLTHAHIDHAGLLPKLTAAGFGGAIYATPPTIDLCTVMLPDSASIQQSDVERYNRRNRQRGRPEVSPVYSGEDVERCLSQLMPVDYGVWIEITPGIRARYWNAGHLLGSASIELEATRQNGGDPLRILFSGDLGPDHKLLQPDPEAPPNFDYVICESTYGLTDRDDSSSGRRRLQLAAEVTAAADRGGALIIPSFAVERTQELLTDLVALMDEGKVPRTRIFLDSPLAVRASEVFVDHAADLENGDALLGAFQSKALHLTQSVEDSKAINRLSGFFIVVAASGMCDAGRVRHHLKNRLWKRDTTVLLVGYQAEGTLGRLLFDGARRVRIHGEEIAVGATISVLDGYSGHADAPNLAAWVAARRPIRRGVFLVHGEPPASGGLRDRIAAGVVDRGRIVIPTIDEVWNIDGDKAEPREAEMKRRIPVEATARLDWNNDLTRLILDINEQVEDATDERARDVILRRLRRALENDSR